MASSDSLEVVPAVTERGEGDLVAERYRLVRKVGSGGMGSVWYAHDLSLDAHCAIKLIDGEKANDEGIRLRFEREAKASAQLRSPHVVNVFDYGVWKNKQYLAMEYLDGEDLAMRLTRDGSLDGETTYRIIAHVSRALMSAHSIGIVHRDLKPENIFLVQNYDEEIAKVLDFGIAQHNAYTLENRATREGAFLGTPCYVSPEQARGRPIDHRSDLWSLGVIAFQCLTGRLPFEGTALGELMGQILYEPLPKPSRIDGSVPKGFDEWWERAAARNRERRFQSAKEMADQLGVVLGVRSVVLVPTIPPRRRASFPPANEHSGVITAEKLPFASVRTTATAPESEPELHNGVAAFKSNPPTGGVARDSTSTESKTREGQVTAAPESRNEVDLYIAMLAAEPLESASSQGSNRQSHPVLERLPQSLPPPPEPEQLQSRAVLALLTAGNPAEAHPYARDAAHEQEELQTGTPASSTAFIVPQQSESYLRRNALEAAWYSKRWTVVAPVVAGLVVLCVVFVALLKGRSDNLNAAGAQSQSTSHQSPTGVRSLPAAAPSSSAETLTVDMLPLIKNKGHNARPDSIRPADSNDSDMSKPGSKQNPKTPRPPQPARDYGI